MSDKAPKKGKLVFKGDKDRKKKKRKSSDRDDDEGSGSGPTEQGWVRADTLDDLVGPVFITHPSDPPIGLTVDNDHRMLAYPLESTSLTEPKIVNQVFVGARLVGQTNSFTFKSCHGKYLSSDKVGVVSCDREAIGGAEEWRPTLTDAGYAFQNTHNKFLMVDEIAGGGFKLRADSDDVGFCETFTVYCQARFKRKQKKEKKEKTNAGQIELDHVKKYQSWGGGRIMMTKEDTRTLKRAKQEGRFAEAMLDRREKVKSDRYCK
ncbi:hypothetical protein EC973_007429 [Apophysomyces ossiformis]|uniref:FRG1-like family-domain-containing protein n=1 Tax=Apophysomyces ossiformis TaxID=679940 RepID=A0A8H7BPW2_9FUNG|nr:hypothetical protein EC973_007400 [Apophysomyces ossiformis]KAF7727555.1 hypothetical protein EC973_007429 [Apophysomyces ossiformis]